MASTATPSTSQRIANQKDAPKLSRKEAARRILGLIECDMTKRQLTEVQKNQLAKQFARNVDRAIAARRKS
jgi:hypothetical protein